MKYIKPFLENFLNDNKPTESSNKNGIKFVGRFDKIKIVELKEDDLVDFNVYKQQDSEHGHNAYGSAIFGDLPNAELRLMQLRDEEYFDEPERLTIVKVPADGIIRNDRYLIWDFEKPSDTYYIFPFSFRGMSHALTSAKNENPELFKRLEPANTGVETSMKLGEAGF